MKKLGLAVAVFLVFATVNAGTAQSSRLDNLMRQKLMHSQRILEAVVTSNWVSLETESRELEHVTTDPAWTVLRLPEYAKHSAAFILAVQNLRRAAAQRDLDAAPTAYVAVTLKCVECHRYMARARIAR